MKAITIQQPWASLIANGEKKYETRCWKTAYRGPIAIHVGLRLYPDIFQFMQCKLKTAEYLIECGITPKNIDELPRGAIIATADLVNIWKIVYHPGADVDVAKHIQIGAESLTLDKHDPDFNAYFVPTEKEIAFGNWTPGNYAWELQNIKILPEPIPAKGKQGLWNWEGDV